MWLPKRMKIKMNKELSGRLFKKSNSSAKGNEASRAIFVGRGKMLFNCVIYSGETGNRRMMKRNQNTFISILSANTFL